MNCNDVEINEREAALYVHIPFCDHKCIYCDFYSVVSHENSANYLNALSAEIINYSGIYSRGRHFSSIFFGGGTPSLMQPDYIHDIISRLRDNFQVDESAEITLETNPGTVDKSKLTAFRQAGINRLSIGIQSFNDEELKFLTRIHSSRTAIETVMSAAEAGFDNINIDLMFNLPGQTRDVWINNMRQAAALPATHISAYSLILEHGTILNRMVLDGKVEIPDEDHDAGIYALTIDFLENNSFLQYEVSNFAKDGFQCRHNNAYWKYRDYISFGTSAHSFADGKRWWNYSSLRRYIMEIEKKSHAEAGSEQLNAEQMLDEFVMLALRSSGLDLDELSRKFGTAWLVNNSATIQSLVNRGLIIRENELLKLTRKGYALCDEVLRLL
ncbi:MAG: radical SAM family heme chaperone HemW [Bacteroidota bacterium]